MSILIGILFVLMLGAFLYKLSGLGKLSTACLHTEEGDRTESSRFRSRRDPFVKARASRGH